MGNTAPHTTSLRLRASLFVALLLIALLWLVFFLQQTLWHDMYRLGILPRTGSGLVGIVTSPLIHATLKHLYSNSLPLFILTLSLFYFHPRHAWQVLLISWLMTGSLVWLIGRESYHIGASGLVYALTSFHFFYGIASGKKQMIALSLVVVFLYGSAIWGMLPSFAYDVSWESHLSGYVTGFVLAILQPTPPPPPPDDTLAGKNGYYFTPDADMDVEYTES